MTLNDLRSLLQNVVWATQLEDKDALEDSLAEIEDQLWPFLTGMGNAPKLEGTSSLEVPVTPGPSYPYQCSWWNAISWAPFDSHSVPVRYVCSKDGKLSLVIGDPDLDQDAGPK